MHRPPTARRHSTQRELLLDEARLCFAVATACLLIGLSGWTINRLAALETPLSALSVVGAFYGLMGLARWIKARCTSETESPRSAAGH